MAFSFFRDMNSLFSDSDITQLRQQGGYYCCETFSVRLPDYFGFCGGVSRAVQLALNFMQKECADASQMIMFGELIHNDDVNDFFRSLGLTIVEPQHWENCIEELADGTPIILPAFGLQADLLQRLKERCPTSPFLDTTCHFVQSIIERVAKVIHTSSALIIYGKESHQETQTIISKLRKQFPELCIIILPSLESLDSFCEGFKTHFACQGRGLGYHAERFFEAQKVIMVNQTTMLCKDVEEAGLRLKQLIESSGRQFEQIMTSCPATVQRQQAAQKCCLETYDAVFVIGGKGSSNTEQLYRLAQEKFPAYFIHQASDIETQQLRHWVPEIQDYRYTVAWRKHKPMHFLLLAGASCPDGIIGDVFRRLKEVMLEP